MANTTDAKSWPMIPGASRQIIKDAQHHTTPSIQEAAATTVGSAFKDAATGFDPATTIAPFTVGLNGVHTQTDFILQSILLGTMGFLGVLVLILRMRQLLGAHIRHLLTLHGDKQQQAYFSRNTTTWWPKVKEHVTYAPIWNKRHNREIKLSSAVNVGTLPTRLQAFLLGLYVLSNMAYCTILDYNVANKYAILAELRGRSGVLAVCNIVPLVLFSGRNNPLISWLQVSFDTYNLLHRWMGRIVVIESVVHTASWAVSQAASAKWNLIMIDMSTPFMLWGGVAVVAAVLLAILSPSPVRHAFYETFLNIHIILAAAFILGTYMHCSIPHLPPLPYVISALILWIGDRFFRILWTAKNNFSRHGLTEAEISVLPGDACRVTLHLPNHAYIKPGSHAYLRFFRLNVWESHPFSICWAEDHAKLSYAASTSRGEGNDAFETDIRKVPTRTSVSFVIQARTGMTRQLFNLANRMGATGAQTLRTYALFEGPYAGHHSLDSYGHVVLFAGASGITHQLPYVQHLLTGFEDGTVAIRRITLVWVIRRLDHIQWAEPWLSTLLSQSGESGVFDLRVFVTGSSGKSDSDDEEESLEITFGRPNVSQILFEQVKNQVGAMCVTVCGPGGLADDVRRGVREVQTLSFVDFIEESFTW